MDKEQEEIQFLGLFGIYKESFKIISSWRKIFGQIFVSMIIPLSFIYLAQIQISELLFSRIVVNEYILDRVQQGTPLYSKVSDLLTSEWTAFWLFKLGYLIFFLILGLLSTSAVVYTVACVYTSKEITFTKIMSVVPKVWKRLMITFLWNFIIVFSYNMVAALFFIVFLVLWWTLTGSINALGWIIFSLFSIIYFVGLFYISIIWHLASVVSVLEDVYGLNAMVKSKVLIRGKMGISIAAFVLVCLCFFAVQMGFEYLVVLNYSIGGKIGYGILCLVLLSVAMLFDLLIQSIIYFICKSYHHENIDKSSLADHLEVYLGEYVPLKSRDVQLEHFQV